MNEVFISTSVVKSSYLGYPLGSSIQKILLLFKHPMVLLSCLNHHQNLMCSEIDPEPYPRDSLPDCGGICLCGFIFKYPLGIPLIGRLRKCCPFLTQRVRKGYCTG